MSDAGAPAARPRLWRLLVGVLASWLFLPVSCTALTWISGKALVGHGYTRDLTKGQAPFGAYVAHRTPGSEDGFELQLVKTDASGRLLVSAPLAEYRMPAAAAERGLEEAEQTGDDALLLSIAYERLADDAGGQTLRTERVEDDNTYLTTYRVTATGIQGLSNEVSGYASWMPATFMGLLGSLLLLGLARTLRKRRGTA